MKDRTGRGSDVGERMYLAGMTSSDALSDVSRTALAVALARARESAAPDRLFDDPYAAAFLTASGMSATLDGDPGPAVLNLAMHAVVRTRFYDDALLAACADGIHQVVLLAAGLDTRAYRLPWPSGVRVYELDLPPVLAFKEKVLTGLDAAASCDRTALATDVLQDGWPGQLVEAGFDPALPSAWLAEGLLVYLTAEEAGQLLSVVGKFSAPGSRLHLERGSAAGGPPPSDPALAHITSLWKGGLGTGTAEWLAGRGWQVEIHDSALLAAEYGRPHAQPSGSGFLTARREG